MALDFQYLEIDGVEFDTYWQNGGYKRISDIIFAEWHIFIVSNLCPDLRKNILAFCFGVCLGVCIRFGILTFVSSCTSGKNHPG